MDNHEISQLNDALRLSSNESRQGPPGSWTEAAVAAIPTPKLAFPSKSMAPRDVPMTKPGLGEIWKQCSQCRYDLPTGCFGDWAARLAGANTGRFVISDKSLQCDACLAAWQPTCHAEGMNCSAIITKHLFEQPID